MGWGPGYCCGSRASAYAGGASAFRTRTAHTLYSGIFEIGSCAEIVSWLALLRPAQWYGMNTVSGRIVVTTDARKRAVAATAFGRGPVAVGNAKARRQPRVHFDPRLRTVVDKWADASGLIPREKLADDAPGGEDDRKLLIHVLGRSHVLGHVQAGLAVREIERSGAFRDRVP